jgi:hypothetical protein
MKQSSKHFISSPPVRAEPNEPIIDPLQAETIRLKLCVFFEPLYGPLQPLISSPSAGPRAAACRPGTPRPRRVMVSPRTGLLWFWSVKIVWPVSRSHSRARMAFECAAFCRSPSPKPAPSDHASPRRRGVRLALQPQSRPSPYG